MAELTDDELLDALGIEVEEQKARTYTAREERIIAGFEDIVRFFEEHERAPQHGEDRDIFERLYAVRLDRLRAQDDCRELLVGIDRHGLLAGTRDDAAPAGEIDDDSLLAELGVEPTGEDDIRVLRHVPTAEERKAAEEVAHREKCEDFAKFKPLFERVQIELETGQRETRPFVKDAGFLKADITEGQFFILGGQTAYVANVGETIKAPNGELDEGSPQTITNGEETMENGAQDDMRTLSDPVGCATCFGRFSHPRIADRTALHYREGSLSRRP